MKILIDMNLSPEWVSTFVTAGIESIHWSTVGDQAAPDRIIMEYAKVNGYVVFTHDLDFGTLLAITKSALPSVIQLRTQDLMPATIGNLVISAISQFQEQLESGALITLDPSIARVRILPII
jgi:predicted nuclease of predicted toxin-antitoxin system